VEQKQSAHFDEDYAFGRCADGHRASVDQFLMAVWSAPFARAKYLWEGDLARGDPRLGAVWFENRGGGAVPEIQVWANSDSDIPSTKPGRKSQDLIDSSLIDSFPG
jgi:hypothetical protein